MKGARSILLLLLGLISAWSPTARSMESNGMTAHVRTGPGDLVRLDSLPRYGVKQPETPSAHPIYIKRSLIYTREGASYQTGAIQEGAQEGVHHQGLVGKRIQKRTI
ncbi:uncharacterized protein LOC121426441 [Lytechinus variegatus]|uniref:uncharacterized protein LOC121426441 n=1 Tax=Lytechinus variegatus TaxID=7654 RepID=UPI001BB1D3EE|nr:uncharacterized protein LOC121426441 [Lytechinus variegatus]